MSDVKLKLLTPEEMCSDKSVQRCGCDICRAHATVKAACERIAAVEVCPTCEGANELGRVAFKEKSGEWETFEAAPCPDCKDNPGKAHKNWQAALRKLGDPT